MSDKFFFDSNILLYYFLKDQAKWSLAESLLEMGGTISLQTLTEISNVMRRKQRATIADIREMKAILEERCVLFLPTSRSLDKAYDICERYKFSIYDSHIIACALLSGCTILYSEDMQQRQVIDGTLTIQNPFS